MATKTPTKRTPAKRTVTRKTTESQTPMMESMAANSPKKTLFSKKLALLALVLIILIVLAYKFKGLVVAATVNGEPISRFAVISQMEHSTQYGGKQAMNDLVTKTLVLQAASKENITVSQADINVEIKKLEDNLSKQGQNLNQLLTAQGLTRKDLEERIKLQAIISKKFGNNVTVTDKEVDTYIEQNKDSVPQNANMDQFRGQVKTQLKQQKLQEKVQAWLQDLQKNAKINYFVQY